MAYQTYLDSVFNGLNEINYTAIQLTELSNALMRAGNQVLSTEMTTHAVALHKAAKVIQDAVAAEMTQRAGG